MTSYLLQYTGSYGSETYQPTSEGDAKMVLSTLSALGIRARRVLPEEIEVEYECERCGATDRTLDVDLRCCPACANEVLAELQERYDG